MSPPGMREGDGATAPSPSRGAVRARLAVSLVFVIMGSTMGGWSARIPEIKRTVGLGDAAWGVANTASTAGDLVALVVVTLLIGRVSIRLLSLVGAALILLNAPLLASSSTTVALVVGLLTWGFAASLLSTPMNAQAIEVERRYGRPLLSTFHACFSFGLLGGGLLGTLAAALGVPPNLQLAATSVLLGTLLAVAGRSLPDEVTRIRDRTPLRKRLRNRFTPQLVLLGSIAFLSSFIEGAAGQWSAIYAADSLGAGAALAAATYTGFTVTIATARLLGDRLALRLGHRRLLRLSALTAALGAGITVTWPHPVAAMAGFAVVGAGIACMTPTVFGLAGKQPGLSSGEGVSVTVIGQWPGFLLAPPVIGAVAGLLSLRIALVTLVVAALGAVALSGRVSTP
ncbi:MFS transporter [Streptomyces sp. TRM 70361]|uniref:MFS transporter n=1 Tax=Streptomyces sp. TRM 70361 TaxID=3116553 RepID=UPI002E7B8425|nr:MFS transporter [Streptomyces sp. TRM 70361]MEE1942767.1 MFS transporter [Streptomyces sp. TRM 70361]